MKLVNLLRQNHENKMKGKERKDNDIHHNFWLNGFKLPCGSVFKFKNHGKKRIQKCVKWVYCLLLRDNFPVNVYLNPRKKKMV